MPTETMSVPAVHCGNCKASIESALAPLEGVEQAAVDVDRRTVTVTYDDRRVDRSRLVSAIEEQGFEVPA